MDYEERSKILKDWTPIIKSEYLRMITNYGQKFGYAFLKPLGHIGNVAKHKKLLEYIKEWTPQDKQIDPVNEVALKCTFISINFGIDSYKSNIQQYLKAMLFHLCHIEDISKYNTLDKISPVEDS